MMVFRVVKIDLSGGAKKPEYRIKDELIRASVIDVMIQYRNVPKRVMGVRLSVKGITVVTDDPCSVSLSSNSPVDKIIGFEENVIRVVID